VYPVPVLGSRRERMGQREHATSLIWFASSMLNTGEPDRAGKESGKEAGETRTAISEALQAVKEAIGV
jgi:hypothetical protein